jgi:hypothetical protein
MIEGRPGTILEKMRAGREIFMVTWEAPREAAGVKRPFLARI